MYMYMAKKYFSVILISKYLLFNNLEIIGYETLINYAYFDLFFILA